MRRTTCGVDIGEVGGSPVITIDKIAQAHKELIKAMGLVENLKQKRADRTRENLTCLAPCIGNH